MNQQSSEWAMGELMCNLLKHVYPNRDGGVSVDPGPFEKLLCDALDAARKVPDGCVRLPDGREPTFQWGKSEPGYSADFTERTGEWRSIQAWFSNADIAAEAARKDGTR